ncbi:MAG: DUF2911 domain-containing protein [Pyrinomonadaceae bacterium]
MISLRLTQTSVFALLFVFGLTTAAVAQQPPTIRLPRPSQKASVMQTIGVTDLTITYSRPGVKGRKIWGDPTAEQTATKGEATLDDQNIRPKDAVIVPYGHVWRTGANEATMFEVTDDVLINGQKLPAGKYSLHTIPNKDEWTIVFNGTANQWGSFNYDPAKDTLRIKAKPQWVNDNQEWLEFSIPAVTANSAQVVIRWEKVAVPFTVEVPNVETIWRSKADAAIAANPSDWRLPLTLANAYASDDKWDEALKWTEQSIKVKETFQNLSAKANFLYASGKKDEALAVAEQAIQRGKTDKVDTTRFEQRLANMKAGKM